MKKILLFSTLAILFNSCRIETEGCTEPAAINYERNADFDDGSCIFEADLVFFYDHITATELNSANFDRLDYYVEESPGTFISIGSEYPIPDFIADGIPNCYEETYVSSTIQWSNSIGTNLNYKVYGVHDLGILGEIETEVDSYSYSLGANECIAIQIRFLSKKK